VDAWAAFRIRDGIRAAQVERNGYTGRLPNLKVHLAVDRRRSAHGTG
jgi:hypothetical protein